MNVVPHGSYSVMAQRATPLDVLDDFPTPPWATRTFYRYVMPWLGYEPPVVAHMRAWEPCAGRCIMSEVMQEFHNPPVFASDVHDYGYGNAVGSFVGQGADRIEAPPDAQLLVTNPPFKLAIETVERALVEPGVRIVAMLLRTSWIETEERYRLFRRRPMTAFCPFSGRVPMIKGRWDPWASTATAYSWFVWVKDRPVPNPPTFLIPPEAKRECQRDFDIERFGHRGFEVAIIMTVWCILTGGDPAVLVLWLRLLPAKERVK